MEPVLLRHFTDSRSTDPTMARQECMVSALRAWKRWPHLTGPLPWYLDQFFRKIDNDMPGLSNYALLDKWNRLRFLLYTLEKVSISTVLAGQHKAAIELHREFGIELPVAIGHEYRVIGVNDMFGSVPTSPLRSELERLSALQTGARSVQHLVDHLEQVWNDAEFPCLMRTTNIDLVQLQRGSTYVRLLTKATHQTPVEVLPSSVVEAWSARPLQLFRRKRNASELISYIATVLRQNSSGHLTLQQVQEYLSHPQFDGTLPADWLTFVHPGHHRTVLCFVTSLAMTKEIGIWQKK
jgi:hypothetical protein